MAQETNIVQIELIAGHPPHVSCRWWESWGGAEAHRAGRSEEGSSSCTGSRRGSPGAGPPSRGALPSVCPSCSPTGEQIKRVKPKRSTSFFSRQLSLGQGSYTVVQPTESLEQG